MDPEEGEIDFERITLSSFSPWLQHELCIAVGGGSLETMKEFFRLFGVEDYIPYEINQGQIPTKNLVESLCGKKACKQGLCQDPSGHYLTLTCVAIGPLLNDLMKKEHVFINVIGALENNRGEIIASYEEYRSNQRRRHALELVDDNLSRFCSQCGDNREHGCSQKQIGVLLLDAITEAESDLEDPFKRVMRSLDQHFYLFLVPQVRNSSQIDAWTSFVKKSIQNNTECFLVLVTRRMITLLSSNEGSDEKCRLLNTFELVRRRQGVPLLVVNFDPNVTSREIDEVCSCASSEPAPFRISDISRAKTLVGEIQRIANRRHFPGTTCCVM